MEKLNFDGGKLVLNKPGWKGRIIYDKETAQAVIIELITGAILPLHKTPVDVFFIVLEGKGIFTVGNEETELKEDQILQSPMDIPHGIENKSEKSLKVLVVKAPKPSYK